MFYGVLSNPRRRSHSPPVLSTHGVIPLNSPACYAPYNRAIEKSIRDLKHLDLVPTSEH